MIWNDPVKLQEAGASGTKAASRFAKGAALPAGWTRYVRLALPQAMSLVATAWTLARSRTATSCRRCERFQAELDRAQTEISLLKEELRIKDARWSRLPSRRRPHYTAIERLRLEVKGVRGWSREQAARIFLLDEQTVRSWQGRVGEEGTEALASNVPMKRSTYGFCRVVVRETAGGRRSRYPQSHRAQMRAVESRC